MASGLEVMCQKEWIPPDLSIEFLQYACFPILRKNKPQLELPIQLQ
jgi:hypothetical protein